METNTKLIEFLRHLRRATETGRIRWQETVNEDAFRVVLDHGMVRVGLVAADDEDGESQSHYAVLLDKEGRVQEEVSLIPSDPSLLDDLYHLAKRSVRNSDKLIEELMGDLEAKTSR